MSRVELFKNLIMLLPEMKQQSKLERREIVTVQILESPVLDNGLMK